MLSGGKDGIVKVWKEELDEDESQTKLVCKAGLSVSSSNVTAISRLDRVSFGTTFAIGSADRSIKIYKMDEEEIQASEESGGGI